jgi:membrane protein implicated in regulation of membrane protease activity
MFGLLGYLLHNFTHLGAVVTLLASLLCGVASALAIGSFISRILGEGGGVELTSASSQMEGRLGTVSMAIRPGGIGEVIFTGSGGARQSAGARGYTDSPVPAGTEVVILSARGGIVTVQPWDEFMISARAGNPPALESIE